MKGHLGRVARLCLILGLAWPLSGCGFEPLYAEDPSASAIGSDVADGFSQIDVAPIPDRLGQQLRNALIDRLTPRGVSNPRYRLEMSLTEDVEGFGLRADRSVTRQQLELVAIYRLIDIETGEPVLTRRAEARTSYDVVVSDFANVSATRDARDRVSGELVDQIVRQLAFALRD